MNTTPSIDKKATIANVLVAASLASATTGFDKAKFDQKMEQENWAEILVDIAKALRTEVVYVNEEISV